MANALLTFESQAIDDGVLLTVLGEVNFSSAMVLRQAITEAVAQTPAKLVIDLAGVPYMDSSGVATMVEALQRQRKAGGRLILSGLQAKVMGIFEIARLHTMFQIVEDTQAALTR